MHSSRLRMSALLAGVALLVVPAGAAADGEDTFASATVISGASYSGTGDNSAATMQGGEPTVVDTRTVTKSVWWTWTAPAGSGKTTVETCKSSIDTVLGVWTGAAVGSLAAVAGNDDASPSGTFGCPATLPNRGSRVTFNANPGTTYKFAVYSIGAAAGGAIRLSLNAPQNDSFSGAYPLSTGPSSLTRGTNVGATKEAGEPSHANSQGGASVWYSYTPAAATPVTIETCGSDFDTSLAVYTGASVGALTEVGAQDDAAKGCPTDADGHGGRVSFNAAGGTTYWIAVDGFANPGPGSQPERGNIRLAINQPWNDNFAAASASDTSQSAYSYVFSNRGATPEGSEPQHGGVAAFRSVWVSWISLTAGPATIDTCGSSVDTRLGVYTGANVGALTPVTNTTPGTADNSDRCGVGSNRSSISFIAASGAIYRIAVDGAEGQVALRINEPSTVFQGAPSDTQPNPADVQFGLGTSDANPGSYECSLDSAAFAPCSSSNPAFTGLAAGAHTFSARRTDSFGVVGPTATRTFTVDPAIRVAFTEGPSGPTKLTSATFGFEAPGTPSFRCALDGQPSASCESPLTVSDLLDGQHTVAVTAQYFGGGSSTAASRTFTVDTTAPETTIGAPTITGLTARVPFSSSEPGGTFVCTLDEGATAPCTSPVSYANLAVGSHTVFVNATDAAGNADPSPAKVEFTVVAPVVKPLDTLRPVVTSLGLSATTIRAGTALAKFSARRRAPTSTLIRFRLSEPARVTVAFAQVLPGRRRAGRCVAATPALVRQKAKRCTRLVARRPALSAQVAGGRRTIRFSGRLSRRVKLVPGTYFLSVTAADAAGNRTLGAKTARLKVVAR